MYNAFLENLFLPVSDLILDLPLLSTLKKWRKIQYLNKNELIELQSNKLRKLLDHSVQNIPYYKDIAKKINYNAIGDSKIELLKFPFLDKIKIKENLPDRILDNTRKTYFIDYTSGSSGVQGEFYSDRDAYINCIAVQTLWWEWAGYKLGDKLFQTGMTLNRGFIKGIKDRLLRVKYIQAFQMNKEEIKNNLNAIMNTNDYFFMGYASSLYTYAKFAKDMGIRNIKFKAVVSWGDKMFPHYRQALEEQFDTEVFDTYGASEGAMIAAECELHNYHIMTPHVYIELLDKNGNEVETGQIGEVVVTRLDNYHMPLIRYKIGDIAIKSSADKTCFCGRQLPMLEKIIGRDTDIVITKHGKYLIVHFFTGIFEFLNEIKQFQVVQHNLDDIEIRYIPDLSFDQNCLERIKHEIWKKAEENIPIRFSKVSKIDPSPSGKPQIVLSELNEN